MREYIHLPAISDLSRLFRLDAPIQHPLITVVDFGRVDHIIEKKKVSADFYCMIFKNYCRNHLKYGRKIVDFQDGSLICMAPNQLIEMDYDTEISENMMGWGVFFHPDLIRATSYCSRLYGRQFITRKSSNNAVVVQIEKGLPTVKYLADQVNLSPGYLSDLLKKETGKNTQDHIHFYLIEEAKNFLLNTKKSVGEIAYADSGRYHRNSWRYVVDFRENQGAWRYCYRICFNRHSACQHQYGSIRFAYCICIDRNYSLGHY